MRLVILLLAPLQYPGAITSFLGVLTEELPEKGLYLDTCFPSQFIPMHRRPETWLEEFPQLRFDLHEVQDSLRDVPFRDLMRPAVLQEVIRRLDILYREGRLAGAIIVPSKEARVEIEIEADSIAMPLIKIAPEFEGYEGIVDIRPLNSSGASSAIFGPIVSSLERRDRLRSIAAPGAPPQHTTERRLPSLALGRSTTFDRKSTTSREVHLGGAVPAAVASGEEFVARFAAYTEEYRSKVSQVIEEEAPTAKPRLDLSTCRWHPGARVSVKLNASHVDIANPVQTFEWNGTWHLLRFDAKVLDDTEVNTIILKFDVAVEGLPLVAIRPEISVLKEKPSASKKTDVAVTEQTAPKSAFASYAKDDRRDVLSRVRSLQIFTGIDVFLDCLSLRPGDEWKPILKDEIDRRDVFWLFWSRSAMNSPWVEWEWRTALAAKTLAKIQPHPLEPTEDAPPPRELSDLQFGTLYEWYLSQLRESALRRLIRVVSHKASWLMRWRRRA